MKKLIATCLVLLLVHPVLGQPTPRTSTPKANQATVGASAVAPGNLTDAAKDALFQQFLAWNKQHPAGR